MNKIGIIYSPGFGAGWSTWGEDGQATDQELAHAIENLPKEEWYVIAEKNWPGCYKGGLDDCIVKWVDEDTQFRIEEYDGSESLEFPSDNYWGRA